LENFLSCPLRQKVAGVCVSYNYIQCNARTFRELHFFATKQLTREDWTSLKNETKGTFRTKQLYVNNKQTSPQTDHLSCCKENLARHFSIRKRLHLQNKITTIVGRPDLINGRRHGKRCSGETTAHQAASIIIQPALYEEAAAA
jgi:hypothetical protein